MEGMVIHIELFGVFRLTVNGRQVNSVNTPRMQALLAYLVLQNKAPQFRHFIAFSFWPDTTEKQARTNLRQLIHNLKKAFPEFDQCICQDNHSLQWRTDLSCQVDVWKFESLINGIRKEQNIGGPDLVQRLESLVEIYEEMLLPSCYDEWITLKREWLHREFIWALGLLVSQLENRGDFQKAMLYGYKLLLQDNLCESTYCQLMRLHTKLHDRAGAIRLFQNCHNTLSNELGVLPGEEVLSLHRQLMQSP